MNFLKKILNRKHKNYYTNQDFWNWFITREHKFHKAVKEQKNIEREFFNELSSKLNLLNEGFLYLAGMLDEYTAELIITPDGVIKNVLLVEDLVNSAPKINGWKFTALKPSLDINDVSIEMDGCKFNKNNLGFYSNDNVNYPDEIDLTIVHNDMNDENNIIISSGTFIFLDNYIGELDSITSIDNITLIKPNEAKKEIIPIEKLQSYIRWRSKEFVEKYDQVRHETANDSYSALTAETSDGHPVIAIINTDLQGWDGKASHPWLINVEMRYSEQNNNGMPVNSSLATMENIENRINLELQDFDGFLNIGRSTSNGKRNIYLACKDFRKASKVLFDIKQEKLHKIIFDYDIYKDKYWRSLEHFSQTTAYSTEI